MSDGRQMPDHHTFTSAEAAAEGEKDDWEIARPVGADDTQRAFDDPEADDEEEELT